MILDGEKLGGFEEVAEYADAPVAVEAPVELDSDVMDTVEGLLEEAM